LLWTPETAPQFISDTVNDALEVERECTKEEEAA